MLDLGLKIWTDFPSQIQADLFRGIYENAANMKTHNYEFIYVESLTRYGYSGAGLFVTYFSNEALVKKSRPYIVKIDNKVDIEAELKAMTLLSIFIDDCKAESHVICEDKGAILLDHKGTSEAYKDNKTKTLADVAWNNANKGIVQIPIERVIDYIDGSISKLSPAHHSCKEEVVNIFDSYDRYFRKHKCEDRIKSILGNCCDDLIVKSFMGEDIINPIELSKLLNPEATIYSGMIHGDLHLDNIVLNDTGGPRLVDFAWGDQDKDIFIDYVLLEMSFRFKTYPKCVNQDDQKNVDTYLLQFDGANAILKDPKLTSYHRLAEIVKNIREKAMNVILKKGYKFNEQRYLLTQYILLYGLMRYDDYDQVSAMRALGLISKHIYEEKSLLKHV